MKRRPRSLSPEDPAVAVIERILAAAEPARIDPSDVAGKREAADSALWICACVTDDDAPTWLIYDTPKGDLVWHRVPDGSEPLDLVNARTSAGGHAEPVEVLRWLDRTADDPWSGAGYGAGDAHVAEDLRRKILDRR